MEQAGMMNIQPALHAPRFGISPVPYKGLKAVIEAMGYTFARQNGTSHQIFTKAGQTNVQLTSHGNGHGQVLQDIVRDIARRTGHTPNDIATWAKDANQLKKAIKDGRLRSGD